MSPTSLRAALSDHLDRVRPPHPDLTRVVERGRRLRRLRRQAVVGGVAGTLLAGAVVGSALLALPVGDDRTTEDYASFGVLDYSSGLRGYANPGIEVYLGGRRIAWDDFESLDTQATATKHGIVFFGDDLGPRLLAASGTVLPLAPAPQAEPPRDFLPSSKGDPATGYVAWTRPSEDGVDVVVSDPRILEQVTSREIACSGSDCADVRIEAFDDDTVVVRTPDGPAAWFHPNDVWRPLAGPETVITDLRARTVLFDREGAPPTMLPSGWTAVPGPIDATLSFDGRYLLDWSSVLRPTRPGDRPIQLERGPDGGYALWAFDTDGSVLVAVPRGNRADVYDCSLPDGACERLDPLSLTGGDPIFIGADM